MSRQSCASNIAGIRSRFSGFALKRGEEDKKIQQENYKENIINTVLLVDCNNGPGNIFASDDHSALLFKMHATINNRNPVIMKYYGPTCWNKKYRYDKMSHYYI